MNCGAMRKNGLKHKITLGQLSIGSWITLGDIAIGEILSNAGYDWLVVDLEHSTITMEQAGDLIRVIDLSGVTPLVRLTSNSEEQVKRVMDAGAHGIIVPMVNTREEAERAVGSTRYGPQGSRGVGLARAQGYGAKFREYLNWQKNEPIVIVQIEDQKALVNLEEIFSTEGVDGFIIGPYDLSCSMSIPGEFEHPDFLDVMEYIRSTGQKMGCTSGLHIVEPDIERLRQVIDEGYRFIAYSVDIRMLDVAARKGLEIQERF